MLCSSKLFWQRLDPMSFLTRRWTFWLRARRCKPTLSQRKPIIMAFSLSSNLVASGLVLLISTSIGRLGLSSAPTFTRWTTQEMLWSPLNSIRPLRHLSSWGDSIPLSWFLLHSVNHSKWFLIRKCFPNRSPPPPGTFSTSSTWLWKSSSSLKAKLFHSSWFFSRALIATTWQSSP